MTSSGRGVSPPSESNAIKWYPHERTCAMTGKPSRELELVVSSDASSFDANVREALAEALGRPEEQLPSFEVIQVDPPGHEVGDEPVCYVTVELSR